MEQFRTGWYSLVKVGAVWNSLVKVGKLHTI